MLKQSLSLLLSVLCLVPAIAVAETLKPSWQSLPSETTFAVRLPDGAGFLSEIRGTRIGDHFFGEERVNEALEVLRTEAGEDWEALEEALRGYGLTPQELPGALRGESGVALVINPSGDGDPGDPRVYVLFWINPGEQLGTRLFDGFLAFLGELDAEHPPVRVDISLAARDVVHLAIPQAIRGPDGNRVVTHNAHGFVTRIDGRILGALTLGSGPDLSEAYRMLDDGAGLPAPDPEPSGEMSGLFARFLQAHEGEDGGFYRELRSASGMDASLPSGVPAIEVAFNPVPLHGMMSAIENPDVARLVEALGFLDLGKMAFRGALRDNVMRWGGMISAPSPRRGIVETILDQEALQPRPPAWVPSSVVDYSHFSLDLGELYTRIREVVTDVMGEEVAQGLGMAEMQVQGMTGENLATTLSSFGNRHTMLMFPAERTVDFTSDDFADNVFSDRWAFVWAPRSEEVWQRIMQSIAMFAPMMGGALQQAEEQGFAGWRMGADGFEGGLFLGRGFLALGMGTGTTELVLSSLRNLPEGENALIGNELFRNAGALMDSRPGTYWGIHDLGPQMGDIAKTFRSVLEMAVQNGSDSPSAETIEWLNRLLDPEVFEEAFGAGVSQNYATRDGLIMESAQRLPPAE